MDKNKYFIGIAEAVSLASPDEETKVGGILVSNKEQGIIATGFNGFIRGAPDERLPKVRPDKYSVIQHCEQNIVAHCARYGISSRDTTLYITLSPCLQCIRQLYNAGIMKVVYRDKYRDYEQLFNLPDLEVKESCSHTLDLLPRS